MPFFEACIAKNWKTAQEADKQVDFKKLEKHG